MKIEQIYTGCLSQGSYYIESEGEVAIIDPLREVKPYLDRAAEDQANIKYIFETHFHADFVSGHITLAKETGASIIFGPLANPSFDVIIAEDQQIFQLGAITIVALHTPGHTMESTTYLLKDASGQDHAIFSGDTLFLGDVGRPDLAQKAADMTQEALAGLLYESLRSKIMPLANDVLVYPAHGAGSACGKNMMKETVDTLGNQKKVNYALRSDMTKEEFVKEVTTGLLPPPLYFPSNVRLNKEGYEDIDVVLERGVKPLSPADFENVANNTGALVLDVRSHSEFEKGHIPRSIFIGLDGSFAPWVGALITDVKHPILLITPTGREEETITRLSRVGFDNTLGYLAGGFETWKKEGKQFDTVQSVSAIYLEEKIKENKAIIIDVRKESEFEAEHVLNAKNTPLSFINNYLNDFGDEPLYIHCAGGYRSMIAISILKSRGIHHGINVLGGYKEIRNTGVETTVYQCSSTKNEQ